MAQEVKLMGATYNDVPAVMLPDSNNILHRFTDASVVTATASDVASGKTFITNNGEIATGASAGSWHKVAEETYQVTTSSSTAETVATLITDTSIWSVNKWIYIRVRDVSGKRLGYFYGSDNVFMPSAILNDGALTSSSMATRFVWRYAEDGTLSAYTGGGTTGYGVYPDVIYSNGNIRIRKRYSASGSLTVDGTYKVEVYLLDPADGVPIFDVR